MKKYLLLYLAVLLGGALLLSYSKVLEKVTAPAADTQISDKTPQSDKQIYINVQASKMAQLYRQAVKLQKAFQEIGKEVTLSDMQKMQSGNFNLYIAESLDNLPKVLDTNAINILWIPVVRQDDDVALLRAFDVIVVKSMASFNHLKAINVRTAFIPDAFNIKSLPQRQPNGRAMFYGDNVGFSLSLYLAGRKEHSLDVYGKGFEKLWPKDEIKGTSPSLDDFAQYSAVLTDQSDEDLSDEIINAKIIEIIENGGVPLLRFNSAVYKIFEEGLPLYHDEQEFIQLLTRLEQDPTFVLQIRQNLMMIAQRWNSVSQAQKFAEIFNIMQKKRR